MPSTLRFGSAKIRRQQSNFQEQLFAFCSFLHCPFPGTKIRQEKTALSVFMPTLSFFATFADFGCIFSIPAAKIRRQQRALSVYCSFLPNNAVYFRLLQVSSTTTTFSKKENAVDKKFLHKCNRISAAGCRAGLGQPDYNPIRTKFYGGPAEEQNAYFTSWTRRTA